MWLLAASCFFYMFFKPVYILILAFTIVIDYFAGVLIQNEEHESKRKLYLVTSLIGNIGVLAVFKYYNFINDNISGIATLFHYKNQIPYLNMILPIGLSFHTFQAMSYTLEVYRRKQVAETHFGIYALYVMFYPQLVAGPIERPQNILPQFHEKKYFAYPNTIAGIKLIAFGLFKKVVVADRLAIYVNHVYGDLKHASSISTILAMIFFAIQIYTDFSGYSDIARGSAKVMGYDLMKNFNEPFMSRSITDFWRRWHISLSTWFNDYLFTPMLIAFRDLKLVGIAIAILITFFISGLWHGAGWTYILYGVVNGIALTFEIYTKKIRKRLFGYLPVAVNATLSQLLALIFIISSWVLFRAETLSKAKLIYSKVLECDFKVDMNQIFASSGPLNFIVIILTLTLYLLISKLPERFYNKLEFSYVLILFFLIITLGKSESGGFIYFQF